jgi:MFS family permease
LRISIASNKRKLGDTPGLSLLLQALVVCFLVIIYLLCLNGRFYSRNAIGYDTGIISAVLVYLNNDLGKVLNASEKELITSITSGGAFIGAIAAGLTADRYGRKGPIYMGCLLFIIGAVLQAAAYSLAQMTVGRLVVGFGVGSAAMVVPLYIAEVAPAKHRGKMIGMYISGLYRAMLTPKSRRAGQHEYHRRTAHFIWNRCSFC